MRWVSIFVVSVAVLAPWPVAAAGKSRSSATRSACMATYQGAQRSARAGRLREAKDLLMRCAHSSCGSFLLHACTSRYTQLDADIPSIVPLVTDGAGEPLTAVDVFMDGQLLTDTLDGHALPIDPGKHEISFAVGGKTIDTQTILIATGQRNRPVSAALPATGEAARKKSTVAVAPPPAPVEPAPKAAPPAEDEKAARAVAKEKAAADDDDDEKPAPRRRSRRHKPEAESSGTSAFAYVFGVTGLAGLGGAALLTYWGRKDNQALAGCSPNCLPASVQHVHRLYQGADVSLGVGVASLLISTWIFIASGSSSEKAGREKAGREEAMRFNVNTGPTGTFAAMAGTF